ncbi:MAG: ATPase [Bacillota bacterium]|nr:ATPase [Bacillota bacterium]
MDIIKLLELLEEIIDTGTKMPLTGKVLIDKEEALNTVEQIVNYLPDEFKKAQWVCEEKERLLKEAREEAENIKKENINYVKKQVENHDIVKEAKIMADDILKSAKEDAKTMRLGARDYADEVLSQLEKEISLHGEEMVNSVKQQVETFVNGLEGNVSDDLKTIRENIKELRNYK